MREIGGDGTTPAGDRLFRAILQGQRERQIPEDQGRGLVARIEAEHAPQRGDRLSWATGEEQGTAEELVRDDGTRVELDRALDCRQRALMVALAPQERDAVQGMG